MKSIVLLLVLTSFSFAFASDSPDFSILNNFPEDARGLNLKATWPLNKQASSYKLRVFRITPSHYETEFNTSKTFFYFKMYPWRLYKWDIQALDSSGIPLGEPVSGRDIYLESDIYPKPNEAEFQSEFQEEASAPLEEDNNFQAQSYTVEDGESELVESPQVEIEASEPLPYPEDEDTQSASAEDSPPWYEPPYTSYMIGLGLGTSSFNYKQNITSRVDLDFSSFTIPSYSLLFKAQWSRILASLKYTSMPGSIDTTQTINGGSDYAWTYLKISGGYQLFKFNLFGKETILSPNISYQVNTIPFIHLDPSDGLNSLSPTVNTINLAIASSTQVTESWKLPFEISYLHPMSTSGDSGSFEINSGSGLSLSTGLEWNLASSWFVALDWSYTMFNVDYTSNALSDLQTGSYDNTIMNTELQVLYQF